MICAELADVADDCHGAADCVALRLWLGRSRALLGDHARARAAFESALRSDPPPTPDQAWELHFELALVAAAARDHAAAWDHVAQALTLAPSAEIVRDMLRARSEMQALRDTPEWSRVLGEGDDLP